MRILRQLARPFEAVGQGVKHFVTGPEYDKVAGTLNAQSQSTGQTQFGSSAPQGPVGAQRSMPSVGGASSYQQPGTTSSKPGGDSGWTKVLPKKTDGSVDWVRAAELGLVVGSAIEGWRASNKANALSQEAMAIERERNSALMPLRNQAITSLMTPKQAPDLSALTDQTNPYRRGMKAVGG